MKLLLIITDYGSFNNFLSELASALVKDPDFEIIVICSNDKIIDIEDKKSFDKRLKFYFINIPRKTSLAGEWKAAKKIRNIIDIEYPNLVHSHFTTASFPTLLLKKSNIPYWATFHGLGLNASTGLKKIVFIIVELMCFLRLQKIYTVNNQDYNLVKKICGQKVKKYMCLGFGCDINKFNRQNIDVSSIKDFREQYSINENHFVIAFIGRFVSFKGFHLVIKAFQQLLNIYPNEFKLILMGGIDPIHPTGLDEMNDLFFKECENIINIGFTSKVEQYLAVTDIFLFPSKKEGLPTCTLESLAMGVPVITFNSRGNNDIIIDNYNGLLLEPHEDVNKELDNIVESLHWIKNNKETLNRLRINALNDRDSYSRERFVNEQIDFYKSFMNNGN